MNYRHQHHQKANLPMHGSDVGMPATVKPKNCGDYTADYSQQENPPEDAGDGFAVPGEPGKPVAASVCCAPANADFTTARISSKSHGRSVLILVVSLIVDAFYPEDNKAGTVVAASYHSLVLSTVTFTLYFIMLKLFQYSTAKVIIISRLSAS